jgi:hypothetical protein
MEIKQYIFSFLFSGIGSEDLKLARKALYHLSHAPVHNILLNDQWGH